MGKYKINSYEKYIRSLLLSSKKLLKFLTYTSKKLLKSVVANFKTFLNDLQTTKLYHWLDYRNYQGLARTLHSVGLLVMAGLILFSAISPLVDIYVTHKYYSLNSQTSGLVGSVTDTLAKQITYDSTRAAYVFNASGMTPATQTVGPDKVPLALLQAKVAGNNSKSKSTYSVVMPTDPKAGISYYDSNTGLSFQLVPNFTEMGAQQIDNHIVYPTSGNTQMVYSVKHNGLKEDIILKQYVSDSLSFSYSLKLPGTLEARLLTDGSGSLGIYSADPSLFGAATTGPEADPAKTESAKLHAQKNHLVFTVPAPVIKQTGMSGQGIANAYFKLSPDGQTLTVSANNLRGLRYPITVDPTVVITSTSDFSTGNNEDNNISYPANQINRGSLTGGSISGGWTGTTVLPASNQEFATVTYNGYIYDIGGWNGTAATANVYYASLNSNGTIGSWTATTAIPVATTDHTAVTYNGYIYVIGGGNGSLVTTVYYAAINFNGSIGAWATTTALPVATDVATSVAYNGYIYEIGGGSPTVTAAVYYAPINANGTIGSWTATTSLPVATYHSSSVANNGYLYEIGGTTGSATAVVDYAPINANGTLGSWYTTTSLPVAVWGLSAVAFNGYLYSMGGFNGSAGVTTVYYAPINANGTVGTWTATAAMLTSSYYGSANVYNGYVYALGGAGSNTSVSYAKIDPAGMTTAYSTTTALPAAINMATSVAYNGYVYEIAGSSGTAVYYAPINTNGTIGSWTATTALPAATYGATSVVYNGYLYEIGGYNAGYVSIVDYAPINTNGTIGAWTATTALPTGNFDATSVAYNGYLYVIGGQNGTGEISTVDYAPINTNGTVGAWVATTSLPGNRNAATSVVYNGYIYEIAGRAAGTYYATVYYAPINSNGTIGAWTATTALPTGLAGATSVVYNGYIYEMGGLDATLHYNNVNYAPINTNGTVGSWTATAALPNITAWATSVVYNGYLYEIGGDTGSVSLSSVYYAFINNGGSGVVGAWTATTVLPAATYAATSAVYNGYLYEIGGIVTGGTYVTTVSYAPINANGSIGAWTATTALPITTGFATSVAYNGYLYEIGGVNGTANVSSVYYAPINTNGTIGAWTTTTALPAATYNATSVAYNGYLYEIGGYTTAYVATVSYAPINSNGTIGTWTATTSLPVTTGAATSVIYNGYLYEIGGYNGTSSSTAVYYAPINANGTVGAWTATTSLPIAATQATSVAYNGYIYEFGGINVNSTYYVPINANGTIGNWTLTTLPTVNGYATAAVYNGYVYTAGGCTGSCAVSAVNYAPLNVMPRVGHYSSLFSFNSPITPVSFTYNGSLPNAYGLSSIQYRTAGSNGVFGSNQLSSVMNGSATSCTPGSAQYLEATLTLDDSGSATFPDVNSTPANVTDFTLTYATAHPSPSLRLRGGKFFLNNSLQSLDTCSFLVPNAPTIGTATAGNMSATVTFTDNAAGDSPITGHTVTAYPGGLTGTGSSPVTVSGLTNGVNYTFTVTATNASGTSAPSAVSNSITPGSIVTGGTLTADATYYYRTFTSSGTLGVSGAPLTADVLAVAGGGSAEGGGGGGGGVLYSPTQVFSTSQTVTVGAGGSADSNGGNSSVGALIAYGGGWGGYYVNAGSGGSGGGSGYQSTSGAGASGVSGQGHNGGASVTTGGGSGAGGGGGGAGGNGANATSTTVPGAGGAGTNAYSSWASATSTGNSGYYAAGGAGRSDAPAIASDGTGWSNSANTGSGGHFGLAGSSGIVIVRYLRTAVAPVTPTVDYLVVAGGGGGGTFNGYGTGSGGGGGAGGVRSTVTATGGGGSLEPAFITVPGTAYTVTVGAGGASIVNARGGNSGSNSVFATITAIGGGGGGSASGVVGQGSSGGSGGGSGSGASPTTGAAGTVNQGFAGGSAATDATNAGGGGGGAGAVGADFITSTGGAGGSGVAISITGSSIIYGGGGGAGGNVTAGAGGSGGGGAGAVGSANATAGAANTGSGGGGTGYSTTAASGAGGSGVVIIRYPNTYPDAVSTTGSPTYSNIGGYKIYKFTSSGSITF